MSELEGVILSDYLLLECVSKGGIADVYRARHVEESLEDKSGQGGENTYEVAVKVFRPGYAQRESFREYFMTEAEKVGQFEHHNILPFLEYGEGEGLLYLVTPFVKTGTLEDLLRRVGGRFSAMQALPIMQQLCSGVQYAHSRNVVHGNIKPTNVFVAGDGRMLLTDFGIARSYDDSQQSLTRVGWGLAEYIAPEQSLGIVRKASDIYSLGVLLFRVLTGSPPFIGQTPVEVLLKHVRQPAPSARSLVPAISDAVDEVLQTALHKRSDDRFSSVEEFSNAFLAAVTVAPTASPVARTASPRITLTTNMAVDNPLTPLPAGRGTRPLPNPQTPVPPYMMFGASQTGLPLPEQQNMGVPQEEFPQMSSGIPTLSRQEVARPEVPIEFDEDRTEIFQKDFLHEQENERQRTSLFWSSEPPEWSPIPSEPTQDAQVAAVPATANEYLRVQPIVTERVEAVIPQLEKADVVEPAIEPTVPEVPAKPTTFAEQLKKWLPIIVVILLLLGLVGAILSSFLLPAAKPSTTGQLVLGVAIWIYG